MANPAYRAAPAYSLILGRAYGRLVARTSGAGADAGPISAVFGSPGERSTATASRSRSENRWARLVALSGYAQPDGVARAAEAGFDAHVAKPPDPERLASLLG